MIPSLVLKWLTRSDHFLLPHIDMILSIFQVGAGKPRVLNKINSGRGQKQIKMEAKGSIRPCNGGLRLAKFTSAGLPGRGDRADTKQRRKSWI
jgi:hypothetical protein